MRGGCEKVFALAIACSILPLACGGDRAFLQLPTIATDGSGILATRDADGTIVMEAFEGAGRLDPQIPAGGAHLSLLAYDWPLASMELAPGIIPAASDPDPGRRIPSPSRIFESVVDAKGVTPWVEAGALDDLLAAIRIPSIDYQGCAERRGCFANMMAERCLPCATPPAPQLPVEAEIAPALPSLLPCRAGWIEDSSPSPIPNAPTIVSCRRPPITERACAAHETDLLSASGCTTIGSACTADDWGLVPESASVRFVRAGAAAGGIGTRASPFATLAEAIAGAPAGAVIALSKGSFNGTLQINTPLTIIGACAAETEITATHEGVSNLEARANLIVRDLTIKGGAAALGSQTLGVAVEAEGVILRDHTFASLYFNGAGISLAAREVLIRSTESLAVLIVGGATARLERLAGDLGAGGMQIDGAETHVEGSTIAFRIRRDSSRTSPSWGAHVTRHANARLERFSVQNALGAAIVVADNARLVATDLDLRNTAHTQQGISGWAIGVVTATLTATGVNIDGAATGGLIVQSGVVALDDLRIGGISGEGNGLTLEGNARVTLRRALFDDVPGMGLFAPGGSIGVDLEDVFFKSVATATAASSLVADQITLVRMRRVAFHGERGALLLTKLRADLADLDIRHHEPSPGRFTMTIADSTADITRMAVRTQRRPSIIGTTSTLNIDGYFSDGASLTFDRRSVVSLTNAIIQRNLEGGGIFDDVVAHVSRMDVDDSFGTFWVKRGARVTIEDARARNISDPDHPVSATSFAVDDDAQLSVNRFLIEDVEGPGLMITDFAKVVLENGVLRRVVTGVMAPEGFDFRSLMNGVIYEGGAPPFTVGTAR